MFGIVGKDLDVNVAREAALNVLALAKQQLGSLDRDSHVVTQRPKRASPWPNVEVALGGSIAGTRLPNIRRICGPWR